MCAVYTSARYIRENTVVAKECNYFILKADARNIIAKVLDEITFGRTEPVLRVNSIRSGFAEDDLKVVLSANNTPPTIAVPKIEQSSDIEWVRCALFTSTFE